MKEILKNIEQWWKVNLLSISTNSYWKFLLKIIQWNFFYLTELNIYKVIKIDETISSKISLQK